MTDPLWEAISVSLTTRREETDPAQTPPQAALPDVAIDVGAEPPEAAWRPSSSGTGNPQQHSRAIWATPVPWYAW